MIIDPGKLSEEAIYKLLVGCVMPRPIAWISTQSNKGKFNLAPFSFFNVASRFPPTLAISISYPTDETKGKKDTLKNIEETRELVVNVVSEELVNNMNISASEFPEDVNEFIAAELDFEESEKVSPPRVSKAKISMECICKEIKSIGVDTLVLAEVININISNQVIQNGKMQIEDANVIGRMAGPVYCTT